jgi:hypothetical protein
MRKGKGKTVALVEKGSGENNSAGTEATERQFKNLIKDLGLDTAGVTPVEFMAGFIAFVGS